MRIHSGETRILEKKRVDMAYREDVLRYVKEQYETEPEYLWKSTPDSAVLRHADNRKWYGVIMDVPRNRLGLSGYEPVDILNVKCDPVFGGVLRRQKGFLPGYHMKHDTWLSVLLDGTVEKDTVFSLIDMSFEMTSGQKKKPPSVGGQREWIVPANLKYYDVQKAFREQDIILWKQSNNIAVGDIVYLYVALPISAILYRCQALEVDIPYDQEPGELHIRRVMRIKKLEEYPPDAYPIDILKTYGVGAVRGPRCMPASLSARMRKEERGIKNGF